MLGITAIVYFSFSLIRKSRVVKETQLIESEHFSLNYKGILKSEAEEMSSALESNYHRIRIELDDPNHDKINVFVHPTQKDFNTATGLKNSTANGTSRGPFAFHLKFETWYNSFLPPDMNKVAVHEFTHCVQLNILIQDAIAKKKFKNEDFDKEFEKFYLENYPQWFWEAICDYEAGMVNKTSVNYGMKGNPTLKELNTSNQIYNVGYTIPEYLVSIYGKEKLPDFIKSYCNFEKVLGVSEQEFENGWHKYVSENY
ncbi:hypothetical protein [Catalinimonas niigatensis]|uniref:hypothetical protein n=1 Tax=Catalinimonas niigatensis TaxID=1397264 RepID=UPI00266538D0|nr:hypothetical protein [Catalinimonas niigatensis]WPP49769.1 hypothetical protein PZB72_24155 [Catalinimonas niigatensis]